MSYINNKQLQDKVKAIKKNLDTLKRFEENYLNLAESIKTVEVNPLKISSDELDLDLKETIKAIRIDKDYSRYKAVKRLNEILETGRKYGNYFKTKTYTLEDQRTLLLRDMLVDLRDSVRFQSMMESAYSSGDVNSREELFYLTVAEAMNLDGVNKSKLIRNLNYGLSKKGYPKVSSKLLKMLM